jgi:cobalt/nickel transport system ATP-binding protein
VSATLDDALNSPAETAFCVRDVSYRYHHVLAVSSLSMQVARGERVALLGANGSGKSTLLRLLAGLCFPEQGDISFFGESLTERRLQEEAFFYSFRRRVGLVFQNPDVQLFNPSVFDEVAFGPLQLRWPKAQIRERVEAALESMGISHLRDRPPHRLSGGEKKRVALASVLVTDPEVLLLDEPSAALDPLSQSQIVDLLLSWKNGSKTVITATHDLDTLEDIADRCYVFEGGRIAGEGTPLQVLHDVPLLERTSLVRMHQHVHDSDSVHPHSHPHLHRHDTQSSD